MRWSIYCAAAFAALFLGCTDGPGGGVTNPDKCKWNSALLASSPECRAPEAPVITRQFSATSVDLTRSLPVPFTVTGGATCEMTTNDMPPGSSSNPNFVYATVKDSRTFSPTYMAPSGWNPGRDYAVLHVSCTNSVGTVQADWTIKHTLPLVTVTSATKEQSGVHTCVVYLMGSGMTSYNGGDFHGTWWKPDDSNWIGATFFDPGKIGISVGDWRTEIRITNDPSRGPDVTLKMSDIPGTC